MSSSLSFLALNFKAIPAGSSALAIRDLKPTGTLRANAEQGEPCEKILFSATKIVETVVEQIIGILESGKDCKRLATTFFALKRSAFAVRFSRRMEVTTLRIVTLNAPIEKLRNLAAGFALERKWIDKEQLVPVVGISPIASQHEEPGMAAKPVQTEYGISV